MYLVSSGCGAGRGFLAKSVITALWNMACLILWIAGLYDIRLSYHGCRSLRVRDSVNQSLQPVCWLLPTRFRLSPPQMSDPLPPRTCPSHLVALPWAGMDALLPSLPLWCINFLATGKCTCVHHLRKASEQFDQNFPLPNLIVHTCTQSRQSTFSKLHGIKTPILGSVPSLDTILPIPITFVRVIPCTMDDKATCCRGLPGSAQMY